MNMFLTALSIIQLMILAALYHAKLTPAQEQFIMTLCAQYGFVSLQPQQPLLQLQHH